MFNTLSLLFILSSTLVNASLRATPPAVKDRRPPLQHSHIANSPPGVNNADGKSLPPPPTCADGEVLMEMVYVPDWWGYEASWEIIDATSRVVMNGNGIGSTMNIDSENEPRPSSACVPADSCYMLIFHQSFVDGIVGEYVVTFDGTVAVTTAPWESWNWGHWLNFNINCGDVPPPSPSGGDSTNGYILMEMEFVTDLRGWELDFEIIDGSGAAVMWADNLYSDYYLGSQTYLFSQYVPANSCYTLIVNDHNDNGLDAPGGYSVTMDGTVAVTSGAFQGQWMNHNINC